MIEFKTKEEAEKLYILSLKHSPNGDQAVWWGPGDKGYTYALEAAGKYSLSDIKGQRDYYNNERSTLAVSCLLADAMSYRCVDYRRVLQAVREIEEAG